MRRMSLVVCLLLWTATLLMAEEFVIRPADQLTLREFSFQTADGDWLVFFSDHSTLSGSIYCHKISAAGIPLTSEAIPLAPKDKDQALLGVIPTSDGNYVIMWEEYGPHTDNKSHTYVQKVTLEGECLWAEGGVLIFDQRYHETRYRALANGIGGITVVFQDNWGNLLYVQSVDNMGNKLCDGNGSSLVTDDGVLQIADMLPYPGGGFLLHLRLEPAGSSSYQVLLLSDTGEIINDNIPLPLDLFQHSYAKMAGPVNGEYLLYQTNISLLEINKAGTDGEAVLAQNLDCSVPSYWLRDIKLLSDGRVAYVLNLDASGTYHIYMLAPDLEPLWDSEEQFPFDEPAVLSECPDGKVLLTVGTRAQFFDASGNRLFSESRNVIDAEDVFLMKVVVLPANDSGSFLWCCINDRQRVIKLQTLNTDGTFTHQPEGLVLEARIAGTCSDTYDYPGVNQCFSLGDRFLSIWVDKRETDYIFGPISPYTAGIYYQLFNQNRQPLLEANGRILQPVGDCTSWVMQSVLGNDNRLYLLYEAQTEDKAFLQAIDYNGNLCFGESGIEVVPRNYIMGCVDDVVYLFWHAAASDLSNRIMGQKYVNGQAQWGAEGEVLWADVFGHSYTMLGFENGFLIYGDYTINYWEDSPTYLKALMFDTGGLITAAGGENSILLSSEAVSHHRPLISAGTIWGDLCVIFSLTPWESPPNYVLQRIDSQGNRLWGEAGISFTEGRIVRDVLVQNDALRFLAQGEDGYNYHSVDAMGNFQTPAGGINIIPSSYRTIRIDFAAFEDDSLICAFDHNSGLGYDIYIRRINADGTPFDSTPVVFCDARNSQTRPIIATYSNTAFITWFDDRAGSNIIGLWGNNVNSKANLLPPIPQPQIIGNYPNPFNPSTTIRYEIAQDGMAKLAIYNIRGQLVDTLVNEHKTMGEHQVVWNGKNSSGKAVASGVYLVRLSSAGKSSVHKMVLMK